MKTILKIQLLSLALLCLPSFAHAQGTAFTYNGRLNNNGTPVTGLYDLRVTLYDASTVGNVVAGPLPVIIVGVTNGLFTAVLDFGTGVFSGLARWLNVEVGPTGGGQFTTLAPRQEVTSSPYAIRAQTAGTAASVANGAVTAGQLNTGGLPPAPGQFLSYNGGNLFWSDPGVAAGNIWSQLNSNAYYNAGNVGIGTTAPSTYGHGGTARILEVNNSGTTLNSQAHLMLYSGVSSLANSAMGTVTWAQPGGMAAYIGAQTRSTTPNAPAAMLSFGTRNIGDAAATPKMVITEDGKVGIGTLNPAVKLDVNGSVYANSSGLYAVWGNNPNGVGVYGSGSSGSGVYGSSVSAFGVEGHSVNDKGVYGTSAAAGPSIAGVWGENSADGGTAVKGYHTGSGGYAVWGDNPNGGGVYGSSGSGFGVYGSSASAHGVEGHSGSGYGVYGKSDNNNGVVGQSSSGNGVVGIGSTGVIGIGASGPAISAVGDAIQSRTSGGFVKAMVYVDANGTITRCYNGLTGATGGACGFSIQNFGLGLFGIDFGFKVDDRFASVTAGQAEVNGVYQSGVTASALYGYQPTTVGEAHPNSIYIQLANLPGRITPPYVYGASFTVIVY